MANPQSIKFAAAHKALMAAAKKDPVWFYLAADVHKESDDGSKLLLHALMDGLRAAYEAGKAGKSPPPLKHLQSIALAQDNSWRESEKAVAKELVSPRVRRTPPAVEEAAKPTTIRRPARKPVVQDEYLEGITNRGNKR